MDKLADLPDDIDALKAIIAEHQSELAFQELMIAKLKAQLDKQLRHRFGASSESLDQLQLTLEGLEITRSAVTPDALPEPAETLKLKPIRKPLPDHLPRREQILDVGDACTQCGGTLKPIGEDVTEELDYVPRRFVVNKIIRPRMTCRCCDRFQQAPMPSRPIERGRQSIPRNTYMTIQALCMQMAIQDMKSFIAQAVSQKWRV